MQGAEQRLIDQLRELRERRNLSQEQLAQLLGVSFATVNRWLCGRSSPSPRSMAQIEQLLRGTGSSPGQLRAPQVARDYADLPSDPFPFVGRARELAELLALWPSRRMLTLTGPGGVGKSRLAIELLRQAGEPVLAVVSLDVVRDPALAPSEIAASLGVRSGPGMLEPDAIATALRSASGVLFLDTCEHVVGSLRELLRKLLALAPAVRVVATSQVPLEVPGEQIWRVPGLELPTASPERRLSAVTGQDVPPATSDCDAVQFFIGRASEHLRSFTRDRATLLDIAEICRRTEGVPLALGLLAAWTGVRSPTEILQRWKEHNESPFSAAGEPERQRTMRSAIEWSNALLTPRERDLVSRLAVFSGSTLFEDIEAVELPAAPGQLLGDVRRLVAVSWLEVGQDQQRSHYRMLEPLREWAEGVLHASGQAGPVRRRHAKYFRDICRQAEDERFSADPNGWPWRLELASGNVKAALVWCAASDPELGAEIAVSLLGWWRLSGRLTEGRYWLRAIGEADVSDTTRARAQCSEALLAMDVGEYDDVRRLAKSALEVTESQDEARWTGRALTALSSAAKYGGSMDRALGYLERALEHLQKHGDQHEIAVVLNNLGSLAADRGSLEDAERHYQMSLAVKKSLGDDRSTALTTANLADIVSRRGRFVEAQEMLGQAMSLAEKYNDNFLRAFFRINQGENLLRAHNWVAAAASFQNALDYAETAQAGRFRVLATYGLGRARCASGDRDEGIGHLRACQRLASEMGDEIAFHDASNELMKEAAKGRVTSAYFGLTRREQQIMDQVAAGKRNKEIATSSGIAQTTVKRHIANIFQSLGVHNRTEAARKWAELHEQAERTGSSSVVESDRALSFG